MCKEFNNDECLICYKSLLIGINVYRLLYDDVICYTCRKSLNNKLNRTKYKGYDLYYFYKYNEEVRNMLLRFKDFFDISLGVVFLKPYNFFINTYFKDYQIVLIPSSETLIKRRNFNHLKLMLKFCKLETFDILIKSDNIQRFSKNRNLLSFRLKDNTYKFDKVIIFDDVISSGYSFDKVINLIKPLSNKIVLISVINNLSKEKEI